MRRVFAKAKCSQRDRKGAAQKLRDLNARVIEREKKHWAIQRKKKELLNVQKAIADVEAFVRFPERIREFVAEKRPDLVATTSQGTVNIRIVVSISQRYAINLRSFGLYSMLVRFRIKKACISDARGAQ